MTVVFLNAFSLGNDGNARKNQNICIFLLVSKICMKKSFLKIIQPYHADRTIISPLNAVTLRFLRLLSSRCSTPKIRVRMIYQTRLLGYLNRRKKPFGITRKRLSWSTWVPRTISERIFQLLREYADIFAWSYEDMSGLDPQIVEHRIPTKPECPPVRQKLRRTRPDMALKIKGEVQKQIDAGFLMTVEYPEWVSNIVPVPKKDGKVRMCVDYRCYRDFRVSNH